MLSAYKNTAYVLLGGALCKAWQLIFSCFSLCALVKRCLEHEKYRKLWLEFSYDDIRYIIVPDIHDRIEIIKTITALPDSCFDNQDDIPMQKNILISKILVLAEIRKDW